MATTIKRPKTAGGVQKVVPQLQITRHDLYPEATRAVFRLSVGSKPVHVGIAHRVNLSGHFRIPSIWFSGPIPEPNAQDDFVIRVFGTTECFESDGLEYVGSIVGQDVEWHVYLENT